MCGRYVVVSKVKQIEKRFNIPNLKVDLDLFSQHVPNYNCAPGEFSPVITNDALNEIQFYRFGYHNPQKSKKPNFIINAKSEGKKNPDNDIHYTGGPGILSSWFWKDAIMRRRCIVFADAFYEGPEKEKLKKPYLCYLLDKQRPLAFAGIWSYTYNRDGEEIGSFAILTHVANDIMQKIGHHRSPVILEPTEISTWLNPEKISDATALLKPYPGYKMNAYPVDPLAIKLGKHKRRDRGVIEPIGQRVYPEKDDLVTHELRLLGMGRRRHKDDRDAEAAKKLREGEDKYIRPDAPGLFDEL